MKGKGMLCFGKVEEFGDLYVCIKIMVLKDFFVDELEQLEYILNKMVGNYV